MTHQQGTVRLFVDARAKVDLERIPVVVGGSDWLGEETAANERGMRQFACDLILNVGVGGPVSFYKSMVVAVGEPVRVNTRWQIAVEWRSATMAPLFPVFVGEITIRPDRMSVDGWYAPPFGVIGTVLDRSLLRIAARATAKFVLRMFASAFGATVEIAVAIVDTHPSGAFR